MHRPQGYALILFALSLSTFDIVAATRRVITFVRSSDRSFKNFWSVVVYKKDVQSVLGPEYTMLHEDSRSEEIDFSKRAGDLLELQNVQISDESNGRSTASEEATWGAHSLPNDHSNHTLRDSRPQYGRFEKRRGLFSRIGHMAFVVAERTLVFAGYGQFLIGIVTYTGM